MTVLNFSQTFSRKQTPSRKLAASMAFLFFCALMLAVPALAKATTALDNAVLESQDQLESARADYDLVRQGKTLEVSENNLQQIENLQADAQDLEAFLSDSTASY